ncbi:MAG TPA: hypothetical protein VD970_01515, partial [Acetobacteraceae bacterium]|nr:hypothetical protein [Acetobacteraceae bacterium]
MEDDTVRLPRSAVLPGAAAPAQRRAISAEPPPAPAAGPVATGRRGLILAGAAAAGLAAAGGGAWYLLQGQPASVPGSLVAPRPEPRLPAGPPLLSEEEMLAFHPRTPTAVRLSEEPRVFVLLFPDLDSQGAALNRIAALIEKRGLPRDRVLNDAELGAAIQAANLTPGTFYYGHNYRGEDVERFFALAERQGVALNPMELWLREQLSALAALRLAPRDVAFVSAPGIEPRVDSLTRRAILRHEIGHGHFFTNPVFAAHIRRVWRNDFSPSDRAAFITFLTREGYDPEQEELMINEMMAYLLFTPDERFFSPAEVG